jgi:hypothetical protein
MNHHKKQFLFYYWKGDIKKKPIKSIARTKLEDLYRDICHFGPLRVLYIVGLLMLWQSLKVTTARLFTLAAATLFVYLYEWWAFYIHNAVVSGSKGLGAGMG